ncbi:hypothetical protein R5R35_012919 [Gryllus longicercus]
MVMNTNRHSYKLESPSAKDYNNGGHYYPPQPQPPPPQHHYHAAALNYGGWYSDAPTHQQVNATQLNLQQYEEAGAGPGVGLGAGPRAGTAPAKEPVATSCRCFGLGQCALGDASQCCAGGARADAGAAAAYNSGQPNRSSSNVLASYGVYGVYGGQQHHPDDDDDDDGFVPRGGGGGGAATYNYHQSVVNYSGSTTSTNILRQPHGFEGDAAGAGGGAVGGGVPTAGCCCLSGLCGGGAGDDEGCCPGAFGGRHAATAAPAAPATTTEPWCANWCRPTLLLLLLVLLVVVLMLISSILLYFKIINFNYIPYKPVPPIIEEPCEKQYCAYGANCVTDGEGRARCQCPADCPDVFAPVCGSDGATYDNHCLLRQKACRDQASVRVQHSGECGAGRPVSARRG